MESTSLTDDTTTPQMDLLSPQEGSPTAEPKNPCAATTFRFAKKRQKPIAV